MKKVTIYVIAVVSIVIAGLVVFTTENKKQIIEDSFWVKGVYVKDLDYVELSCTWSYELMDIKRSAAEKAYIALLITLKRIVREELLNCTSSELYQEGVRDEVALKIQEAFKNVVMYPYINVSLSINKIECLQQENNILDAKRQWIKEQKEEAAKKGYIFATSDDPDSPYNIMRRMDEITKRNYR